MCDIAIVLRGCAGIVFIRLVNDGGDKNAFA